MNILLAIDGSSASDRAARHVVQLAGQLQSPPMLLMVNVAAPLLPQAARKLGRKSTAEYYASGSEYAVRKARSILDRAGVAYSEAFPLGDAAEEVTRLAEKHDIDLVVVDRKSTRLNSSH